MKWHNKDKYKDLTEEQREELMQKKMELRNSGVGWHKVRSEMKNLFSDFWFH